jgi:hypothetical protein
MFYIGGAGKKHAVREIMKRERKEPEPEPDEETDDRADDRSRSRSRSRSMTRISHASGDIVDDDTDADTDADADAETDDESASAPDINDYLTTLGSINTAGHHHRYSFTEEELDYDLEEFADAALPELKEYQLVIYRINTRNTTPFLEFLFYHDDAQCRLPDYHHKAKHHIRKETDGIMDKLFTSKYRFKGFFHDDHTDKCFVFYEKYFDAASASASAAAVTRISHNWFWVCTTEIIHHRKYMTIPIHTDAIDFFIAYPTVGILQATLPRIGGSIGNRLDSVHIEAPSVLYYGSTFCYAKNTALYGLKREPIIARYGPFYYFTTLEHSYYWACYHNAAKTSTKRETGNGGISRYAVFTKRMKTVFIDDDDYDVEMVKKYTDRKNMFETKINEYRRNQEVYQPGVYDSIYSYDYTWTTSYDTIYNGYYDVNNNLLRPVWCVGDHRNFELLSYYEVDTDKIPAHYDDEYTDYTIM